MTLYKCTREINDFIKIKSFQDHFKVDFAKTNVRIVTILAHFEKSYNFRHFDTLKYLKRMKLKQKIILFIEPNEEDQKSPRSIGNLYLNRFVINEDAADEVLNIFQLEKCERHLSEKERDKKGMGPIMKL